MPFTLPPLPYATTALEPYIDAQTMTIHHDKHHQAYVDNLNKAIAGTDNENKSLEDIVKVAGTISPAVRKQRRRALEPFFFLADFSREWRHCANRRTGRCHQQRLWFV